MNAIAATADLDLLMAYATHRNADAFAELVRRYAGLVYGVGLRITGNSDDAQDVSQECFLQLAAQADRIAQPLPAWLHTLARSRAIDLTRRRSARQRNEQKASRPEGVSLSLQDWEALSRQVDEAIESLDEEMRLPLIGHYLQGWTQQELAEIFGVSQGTVSRRIERAIEQLREHLRKAGVDMPTTTLGLALPCLGTRAGLPANLVFTLTKMGLSGLGAKPSSGAFLSAKLRWMGMALIALVGSMVWWLSHTNSQTSFATTESKMAVSVDSQVSPIQLKRENGKVWLDGLTPGQHDTSPYPQGLSIILQYLGHNDADYIRVMGYSGMAFALQVDLSGPMNDGKYDVAWWPNDSWVFDMRLPFLAQAFGRELSKVNADPVRFPTDEKGQYQAIFAPVVMASVQQGRPLLGNRAAARVIYGHDQTDSKAIGLWPSPGQPVFGDAGEAYPLGLVVPGGSSKPLPQAQAEIESLRWAIALGEDTAVSSIASGDKLGRPDLTRSPAEVLFTGQKAYAKWLELLADKIGVGWDQNIIIHLRYNRLAAVDFLRDVASRQSEEVASHILAAADQYQLVLDDTARAPFCSQFANNPELRPQKRQEYIQMVRRVAQLEAQAIAELRLAVAAAK